LFVCFFFSLLICFFCPDGFDRVESIAVLSHVTPEELARQLTLLDQKLYRKLQGSFVLCVLDDFFVLLTRSW
jgi:hypothetical protein